MVAGTVGIGPGRKLNGGSVACVGAAIIFLTLAPHLAAYVVARIFRCCCCCFCFCFCFCLSICICISCICCLCCICSSMLSQGSWLDLQQLNIVADTPRGQCGHGSLIKLGFLSGLYHGLLSRAVSINARLCIMYSSYSYVVALAV